MQKWRSFVREEVSPLLERKAVQRKSVEVAGAESNGDATDEIAKGISFPFSYVSLSFGWQRQRRKAATPARPTQILFRSTPPASLVFATNRATLDETNYTGRRVGRAERHSQPQQTVDAIAIAELDNDEAVICLLMLDKWRQKAGAGRGKSDKMGKKLLFTHLTCIFTLEFTSSPDCCYCLSGQSAEKPKCSGFPAHPYSWPCCWRK